MDIYIPVYTTTTQAILLVYRGADVALMNVYTLESIAVTGLQALNSVLIPCLILVVLKSQYQVDHSTLSVEATRRVDQVSLEYHWLLFYVFNDWDSSPSMPGTNRTLLVQIMATKSIMTFHCTLIQGIYSRLYNTTPTYVKSKVPKENQ